MNLWKKKKEISQRDIPFFYLFNLNMDLYYIQSQKNSAQNGLSI